MTHTLDFIRTKSIMDNMTEEATNTHGGKRNGAGRIAGPYGPTVRVTVSIPEAILHKLDTAAQTRSVSRSAAVTEACHRYARQVYGG